MHVIEENGQLDGEREQRAPRPKSKVRSNPAHLGANLRAIFSETGGGLVLEKCVGKEAKPPEPHLSCSKLRLISLPAAKFVNAAIQLDRRER
jgi:hypothetical protein